MSIQRVPKVAGSSADGYRTAPAQNPTGGGSVTYNQYAMFFEKQGPASYATGGFVVDLSATFSSLNSVKLAVKKGSRGSLPGGRLEYLLNTPTAGKVTVKVQKYQFTLLSAIGNVQGQPVGVTVQGASGAVTSAEAAHIHTIDHDHSSAASSAATNTGAAVNSALTTLNQNVGSHTHSVNLPNLPVNSGAGSSHTHADNNVYQHQHSASLAATNLSSAEVSNATNLSTTLFYGIATGVRNP